MKIYLEKMRFTISRIVGKTNHEDGGSQQALRASQESPSRDIKFY